MVESYGRWIFTFSRSSLRSKVVVPFYIPHQQCLRAVLSKLTEEPMFLPSPLSRCQVLPSFLRICVREMRIGVRDPEVEPCVAERKGRWP